ncbi:hypothetical protein PIB30_100128, partial [Stylosanthes scabra]|nr:hypothetical protein [Stylosanthes scabra]
MELRFSGPVLGLAPNFWRRCRGIQKCVSHSDPGMLLFDPENEQTLRRARQAKRRAELARLASDKNPLTMGEILTLKQIGGASTAFANQPNRFPELNANFELKSGLINLLPSSMVGRARTRLSISRILKSFAPPLEGLV